MAEGETAKPIRFNGASWCPDSRRSERFLREHEIPFEYVDVDRDEGAAEVVRELNRGRRTVPLPNRPSATSSSTCLTSGGADL